jgi:class 3 adenylate cyclase/tetratricopeptide (TPR) repeat protein
VQLCPNCGEENPDRFRLCGFCGTSLAPETVAPEVRRTVSIVFSDLKGSTSLGERLDTESLREVLNLYFDEMRKVLERHGGTVEKYIGDAIMAVFGLPRLHEDDAVRAVRAAFEMKAKLEEVNEQLETGWGVRLENRTGVNTGEVVAGDVSSGQRLVTGDTVNTAARLEQAAPSLEILIGEPTYRLVRDAVEVDEVEPLELKGKAERVPAYKLLSVSSDDGVARRLDAPMVGRVGELELLTGALDRARSSGHTELVTVFGPAGVGKSRLLREFLARAGNEVWSLRGRCLSYGDGITFWPLGEVVRSAAGISDDDAREVATSKLGSLAEDADVAERVGAAIGLVDTTFPIHETFWAARRLLESLAARKPLIVLIDDIHWAEATFLDLLRFVLDSGEAPVILVCSSRKDLLEEHPEWGEEGPNARAITLEPLSEQESSLVVDNMLGSSLDERVRSRIIGAAEGNPLFVEQMLSMLIDDGALKRNEDGTWAVMLDVGEISIPPSISALLTARLDRLGITERSVIERGAVIGQVFFRGAVEDLGPENLRSAVVQSLQGLSKKELIRQDETTQFAGQEAYRFLHILIRDAAYHGLLKRTRAELHEAFVDWLERVASDRVMEYEEIRGYHLEQAYVILVQLAPIDDHARQLGLRGSSYLASAGRRALARGDMGAASSLLRRAATLLPPGDRERPRLFLDAAEATIEAGDFVEAKTTVISGIEEAKELGDRGLEIRGQLIMLDMRFATDPTGAVDAIVAEVEAAIPHLESLEDHEGLARAWRLLMLVNFDACRWRSSETAADQMFEHARLAGNTIFEARQLPALASCALYGPRPVPEAIEICRSVLERSGNDRKSAAVTTRALAQLEAMRGDFALARDLYRQSRTSLDELGWHFHAALTSLSSGLVEMLAGDAVTAESELRRDYEALEGMGEKYYLSTTAGYLAAALFQQGRDDEADEFASISERLAAADDISSQFLWRTVRGRVLARRGDLQDAEAMIREALELIGRAEEPDSKAAVLADLAEVLALAGRRDEARGALEEAASIFESKGNVVSAARARERIDSLAGDQLPADA